MVNAGVKGVEVTNDVDAGGGSASSSIANSDICVVSVSASEDVMIFGCPAVACVIAGGAAGTIRYQDNIRWCSRNLCHGLTLVNPRRRRASASGFSVVLVLIREDEVVSMPISRRRSAFDTPKLCSGPSVSPQRSHDSR